MSPELLAAVTERVERGYSDDLIREELTAAGHSEAVIVAVLREARGGAGGVHQIPVAPFPSSTTLLSEGWGFFVGQPRVSGLLLVPVALSFLLYWVFNSFTILPAVSAALQLGVVLLNVYATMAAMHFATKLEFGEPTTVYGSFVWSLRQGVAVFVVTLLSVLVLTTGLSFFIVPGLIVLLYIVFTYNVVAQENLRGLAALQRSHQLVSGNFWHMVKSLGLLFVQLLAMLIVALFTVGFLIAIVDAILGTTISDTVIDGGVSEMLAELGSVVMTVVLIKATATLYRLLTQLKPYDATQKLPAKALYIVLAICGAALLSYVATHWEELTAEEEGAAAIEEAAPAIDYDAKGRAADLRLE